MEKFRKNALVLVAAGMLLAGCQSNKNAGVSATAAADHAKADAVCDMPGQGAAVANAKTAQTSKQPVAVYGGEQKLTDADAVTVSTVLAHPDQYKDKYVRVTGKVTSVCAKKGCWLRVAPDKATAAATPSTQPAMTDIFIKFRDPPAGRLIPMEASGKNVTVEGVLKIAKMSEAAARHFMEDGGASKEEIEKVVGPQPQLVLTKPVVAVQGIEKTVD
jgi:hypothetical protein